MPPAAATSDITAVPAEAAPKRGVFGGLFARSSDRGDTLSTAPESLPPATPIASAQLYPEMVSRCCVIQDIDKVWEGFRV